MSSSNNEHTKEARFLQDSSFHPTRLRTLRFLAPSILPISVLQLIANAISIRNFAHPSDNLPLPSYVSLYFNSFANAIQIQNLPFHPTYLRTLIHLPNANSIPIQNLLRISVLQFILQCEEHDDFASPSDTLPFPSYVSPYSTSFANARNNSKSPFSRCVVIIFC